MEKSFDELELFVTIFNDVLLNFIDIGVHNSTCQLTGAIISFKSIVSIGNRSREFHNTSGVL